jgi:hypothetical protein
VAGSFERFIGIDWSGAAQPSGQHVFVAEAGRRDARITLHTVLRARDRAAVEDYLAGGPLAPAPAWEDWPAPGRLTGGRRVVALDFAFGFPSGFDLPSLGDHWTWSDLGRWADGLDPRPNGNGVGDGVRAAITSDPELASRFRLKGGDAVPDRRHRLCDSQLDGLQPESVYHLIGPSQVGLGSITGMAMLHRLVERADLAIWPFHPRARVEAASVVLVEVWPRMWLQRGIRKNELPDRVRQLEAWAHDGVTLSTKAEVAAASSADAMDAAAAAIGAARSCYRLPSPEVLPEDARLREGWIAGVQVP